MKTIGFLLAALLLFAVAANAQKVEPLEEFPNSGNPNRLNCIVDGYDSYMGNPGFPIPDCDPGGVLLGPVLTADNGPIVDVILAVNMTHTWVGDLRLFLQYDDGCGTALPLDGQVLCRLGLDDCLPDGCCGCSGDLSGWYEFDDAAGASIEDDCPSVFAEGCYAPDYDSYGLGIFDGQASGGCFWLWVADGACADTGEIIEWEVHVLTETAPTVDAALDIKPTSCPNPFNVKARGKLPVAVLGTDAFDVMDIDVMTLSLECPDGSAEPIWYRTGDVATPVGGDPDPCDCTEEGPDGFMDLKLKFLRQDITDVLGPYEDGDEIELTLTGELMDGTPFSVSDCIWILDKGKDLMAGTTGNEAVSNPAAREDDEPSSWATIKALYR